MARNFVLRFICFLCIVLLCQGASLAGFDKLFKDVTIVSEEEIIAVESEYYNALVVGVIRCNSISISGVRSNAISVNLVETHVDDLSFTCATQRVGLVSPLSPGDGLNLGGVSISSRGSSLVTTLLFRQPSTGNITFPELLSTDWDVQENLDFEYLGNSTFLDGIVNTIIDVLEEHFADRIGGFIRDKLGTFSSPVLADGMRHVGEYLHGIVVEQTSKMSELNVKKVEASYGLIASKDGLDSFVSNDEYAHLLELGRDALLASTVAEKVVNPVQKLVKAAVGSDPAVLNIDNDEPTLLYKGGDRLTDVSVFFTGLSVGGLDSIHHVDILKRVGDFSFTQRARLETLTISAKLRTQVELSGAEVNKHVMIQDEFEVSVSLEDVQLEFTIMGGISTQMLQNLAAGSLLATPAQCLVKSLYGFYIPHVTVDFANSPGMLPIIRVMDSNTGLSNVFQEMFDAAMTVAGNSISYDMPEVASYFLEKAVKQGMDALMNLADDCDPISVPQGKTDYLNFQTNEIFMQVTNWLEDNVIGSLNIIVPDYFDVIGETPLTIIQPTDTPLGKLSMFAHHARVTNLDTFHNTEWMKLVQGKYFPYQLRNRIVVGSSSEPVTFSARFILSIEDHENPEASENNEFLVSFEIQDLSILLELIAQIDLNKLKTTSISGLTNLHCWLGFIDGGVSDLVVEFQKLKFDLTCIRCPTNAIREIEIRSKTPDAAIDLTTNVNDWLQSLFGRMFSQHRWGEFNNYVTQSCEAGIPLLGSSNDQSTNPSSPSVELSEDAITDETLYLQRYHDMMLHPTSTLAIGLSLIVCLFCSAIFACCLHPSIRRRQSDEQQTPLLGDVGQQESKSSSRLSHRFDRLGSDMEPEETVQERSGGLDFVDDENTYEDGEVNDEDTPLCSPLWKHPYIPYWVRVVVPLSLALNVALFVVGHTMVGAIVSVHVEVAGKQLDIPQVATFSLGESINGMWKAKAYPLAILIASLSGVWPYTKLLCLGYCWFVSPSWKSPEARSRMLMFLDFLGKWSLIDVYVLVFCVVAYDLDIANPNLTILPTNFYYVSVRVMPSLGLITFTTAAMLSLLTNNLCIVYNRLAIEHEQRAAGLEVLWTPSTLAAPVIQDEEMKTGPPHETKLEKAKRKLGGFRRGFRAIHARKASEDELEALTVSVMPQSSTFLDNSKFQNSGSRNEPSLSVGPTISQRCSVSVFEYSGTAMYSHYHNRTIRIRLVFRLIVLLSHITGLVLIVEGGSSSVFTFETSGIVGVAVDFQTRNPTQDGSRVTYNLVSFFSAILESSIESYDRSFLNTSDTSFEETVTPTYTHHAVYVYLALAYLVTALFVPVIHGVTLILLWVVPMTLKWQKRTVYLCEGIGAWASLEVFLISLIVAALELSQVSNFLIGHFCDNVQPILKAYLVPLGIIWAKDATCLKVDATLNLGCAKLVAGGVTLNFVGQVVQKLSEKVIHQRDLEINEGETAAEVEALLKGDSGNCCRRKLKKFALNIVFQTEISKEAC